MPPCPTEGRHKVCPYLQLAVLTLYLSYYFLSLRRSEMTEAISSKNHLSLTLALATCTLHLSYKRYPLCFFSYFFSPFLSSLDTQYLIHDTVVCNSHLVTCNLYFNTNKYSLKRRPLLGFHTLSAKAFLNSHVLRHRESQYL